MKQRVITGLIMGLILIPLLAIKEIQFLFEAVMLLGVMVASNEIINLSKNIKKTPITNRIIIILLTVLVYLAVVFECTNNENVVLIKYPFGLGPTSIVVMLVLLTLMVFSKDFDGVELGRAFTAICYSGICLGALGSLRIIGVRFIAYLFMVTMCTDIFAYFGGYLFGKHKMAPVISPKKTWEGAIVGSAVAVLLATLFAVFYGNIFEGKSLNLFQTAGLFLDIKGTWLVVITVLITLGMSICGQIGDLVASRLKRTYDVKDYSNLFPGHGGVMDRFDSAMFAALIMVIIFIIF